MRKLLLFLSVLACGLAGCAAPSSPGPSGPSGSSGSSSSAPSPGGAGGGPEPSDSVSDVHSTYGLAVPTTAATIAPPFTPPPLRALVGIYTGDHPGESPAYQRMSFYFKGGYP